METIGPDVADGVELGCVIEGALGLEAPPPPPHAVSESAAMSATATFMEWLPTCSHTSSSRSDTVREWASAEVSPAEG